MGKKLVGRIVPLEQITQHEKEVMFQIFERHYQNVNWELYLFDMSKKNYIILLEHDQKIYGFSTQQIFTLKTSQKIIRILFSGDTVIDQEFWGEQELVRSWCSFAGQILAQEPATPLYWYLLTKGYRTYMYLPLFFRNFYPCHANETPAFIQEIIDAVSLQLYPNAYNPKKGILEFVRSHGNLKAELATIPASKQNHPHVQFFLKRNPDYAKGSELICLAEISVENMRSFAANHVSKGLHIPLS